MGRDDQAEPRATRAIVQRTGKAKARPARATEFTAAKRQVFLDAMAATANAQEAARTAGVNVTTAYRLRHLAPEFAADWDGALEIGYLRLEEELLARALEAVAETVIDPTAVAVTPLPPLAEACAAAREDAAREEGARGEGAGEDGAGDDAVAIRARTPGGASGWAGRGLPPAYQLALALLNRRNGILRGNGRRPGGARKPMSGEEITAMLIDRLDVAAAIADRGAAAIADRGAAAIADRGAASTVGRGAAAMADRGAAAKIGIEVQAQAGVHAPVREPGR